MLPAAALFNKRFQLLLKLQLCLQHMIRCIRQLHPALLQTKKDNTRSSPASSENKSKATKIKGTFNDQVVRKMVHRASYATSNAEFFNRIYEGIQLLVDHNPALISDITDVGIYLLEFNPHLWTSVANTKEFALEKYLLLLEPMHYEFLYIKYFFCPHADEKFIDITTLNKQDWKDRRDCAINMARGEFNKFDFHMIISQPAPAPRFNNSSTNISELFGWIMKSNGFRWDTIPQFVRQCIHVYNLQIQQMIDNYHQY